MKKNLLSAFIILATFAGNAQNLVQNGDFEQNSGCPTGTAQIDKATPWTNPCLPPYGINGTQSGSSDYHHSCSTSLQTGVPNNAMGYQPAHSGNGYSGFYVGLSVTDFREYIEATFSDPLIANNCYQLSLYVSLSNMSSYAVDTLGIYFSNTYITGLHQHTPLPYVPQLQLHPGYISETLSWMYVSTTFTATGGENYMIIGNFNNDANTNFLQLGISTAIASYIYIDDVCIVPCGSSCTLGIIENKNEEIKIFPNPVGDKLKIQNAELKIKEIKIFDMMGREILKTEVRSQKPEISIDMSSFQKGIYIIELNGLRKKIIKQ